MQSEPRLSESASCFHFGKQPKRFGDLLSVRDGASIRSQLYMIPPNPIILCLTCKPKNRRAPLFKVSNPSIVSQWYRFFYCEILISWMKCEIFMITASDPKSTSLHGVDLVNSANHATKPSIRPISFEAISLLSNMRRSSDCIACLGAKYAFPLLW